MPCPVCRSNDLWDDNLAWGCNRCDFFTTGGITNTYDPADRFNGEQQVSPPVYYGYGSRENDDDADTDG